MNRASGTCGTITKDITFVSSESQKEKRTNVGQKKIFKEIAESFQNLPKVIKLIDSGG